VAQGPEPAARSAFVRATLSFGADRVRTPLPWGRRSVRWTSGRRAERDDFSISRRAHPSRGKTRAVSGRFTRGVAHGTVHRLHTASWTFTLLSRLASALVPKPGQGGDFEPGSVKPVLAMDGRSGVDRS